MSTLRTRARDREFMDLKSLAFPFQMNLQKRFAQGINPLASSQQACHQDKCQLLEQTGSAPILPT